MSTFAKLSALLLACFVMPVVGPPFSADAAVLLVPEAFSVIQAAVDAASSTDTISIAAGIYSGSGNRDIVIDGKSILIRSRAGSDEVILDCQQAARGFYLEGHGSRPVFEGITIRNGYTNGGGGAVFSYAILWPTFRRCVFEWNEAFHGGAVDLSSAAVFEGCRFSGNESFASDGGAVLVLQNAVLFDGCVFAGNYADHFGGAVASDGFADMTFRDCTITANRCSGTGGGGIFSFDGPVTLERTICWGNCADLDEADEIYGGNRRLTLRCSDVRMSGVTGDEIVTEDAIDLDPLFCEPWPCVITTAGNYTLRSDSPCLPAGNPCAVLIGALDAGCPAPGAGACCLMDGSCVLGDPAECAALQGEYLGNGTSCSPDLCEPVPVMPTSWGRIKAAYGNAR